MRINFYLSLIILILLLTSIKGDEKVESKNEEKMEKKEEIKFIKQGAESDEPPELQEAKKKGRFIDLDLTDEDKTRESHTIALTSSNFDSIIQNGIKNRWLIIFYAETCGFCKKAKSLIDKIIEEKKYKNVNNIKFASVDIDYNYRLQMRFNVTGIPIIFLVENNRMAEMSNLPIEENFIKAIEVESLENLKSVKDFQPEISLYEFIRRLIDFSFSQLTMQVNLIAKNHNINYEFSKYSIIIIILFFCICFSFIFLRIIDRCFPDNKKVIKKDIKDSKESQNNEIKEEKNIVNNNNDESEEMKKIIEEKKEEEMKEKLNKEKEKNNKEGEIKKKEKKKKKE